VDATKGRVRLTSIDATGKKQSADFYDGIFTVVQPKSGKGRVDLILKPPTCPAKKARAAKNGKPTRLWGKGKGKFRTKGRYGAATVTGTWWLTEDRCTGTFVRVREGTVSVRDIPRKKTVSIKAGKSYLAKAGK
jgi:hypothetical protein